MSPEAAEIIILHRELAVARAERQHWLEMYYRARGFAPDAYGKSEDWLQAKVQRQRLASRVLQREVALLRRRLQAVTLAPEQEAHP